MRRIPSVFAGLLVALPTWAQDMPLSDVLLPGEGWQLVSEPRKSGLALATGPHGLVAVAAPEQKQILLIDKDGKLSPWIKLSEPVTALAFGPDGRLYGAQPKLSRVLAWDKEGKETVVPVQAGGTVQVESEGKIVGTFKSEPPPGKERSPLDRLDPAKIPATERFPWQAKELVAVLGEHRMRGNLIAPSPDGKTLAVSSSGSPYVRLGPMATLHETNILTCPSGVYSIHWSPVGDRLAVNCVDGVVRLYDGRDPEKIPEPVSLERSGVGVASLSFSGDAKYLIGGDRTPKMGTAWVWDLATKESVLTFPDHQNGVFGVAVKADSKVGFSAGLDKQLRMWNATGDGKQIRVLGGHGDDILKLVAHPPLPILVTTSADKTIKVWDANSGANTKTLPGMTDHVFAAAISPDGTLVAAGAYDGEVKICSGKVQWDGTNGKGYYQSPITFQPKHPLPECAFQNMPETLCSGAGCK